MARSAAALRYPGWRAQRSRVLKVLLGYQAAIVLLISLTLSWSAVSVVLPLAAFSMAVLAYATYHFARDGDWEVIHIIFGANLRDVVGLMRSPDLGRCYGLTAEDQRALARLAGRPEALETVQQLFASHRIVEAEPDSRSKRFADVILLLLGAIVGAVAQRRLAPPPGAPAEIWKLNLGEFVRVEWFQLIVIAAAVGSFMVLSRAGKRRAAAVQRLLVQRARERPLSLFSDTFAGLPEVRAKIRDAVRWAARLAAADVSSVLALQNITGVTISPGKREGTALGDIEWTMLLFDLGIVAGVVLPPLLGVG